MFWGIDNFERVSGTFSWITLFELQLSNVDGLRLTSKDPCWLLLLHQFLCGGLFICCIENCKSWKLHAYIQKRMSVPFYTFCMICLVLQNIKSSYCSQWRMKSRHVRASNALKSKVIWCYSSSLFALFDCYITSKREFHDYLFWHIVNLKLQPLCCADQELEQHVLPLEAHGATNATRP